MAAPLLAGGAAFGGALMALNGTRRLVADIAKELRDHAQSDSANNLAVAERLARIETILTRERR